MNKEEFIEWLLNNGMTKFVELPFLPAPENTFEYENKNISITLNVEENYCFIYYEYLLTNTKKIKVIESLDKAKQFIESLLNKEENETKK